MIEHALVIDHESCWGCKTCEVACKQEHHSSEGVKLIAVAEEGPKVVDGKLTLVFHVNVCRHCEDPPCADVCPEDAISTREDGIVVMDYEICTGCRVCIDACPYDAIAFDEAENVAQKCNLCYERVEAGLIPACADNVCLAHCIHFGDPQDRKEAVSSEESLLKGGGSSNERQS